MCNIEKFKANIWFISRLINAIATSCIKYSNFCAALYNANRDHTIRMPS